MKDMDEGINWGRSVDLENNNHSPFFTEVQRSSKQSVMNVPVLKDAGSNVDVCCGDFLLLLL